MFKQNHDNFFVNKQSAYLIAATLIILVIATRNHHFGSAEYLPGASWAAFFLAGVYLRSHWGLIGLFTLTWSIDFAVYTWGGGSGFCITPAYIFLLPAYFILWIAGRWYSQRLQFNWLTIIPLTLSVLVSAFVCELLSSGGFYFFSGRFSDPSLLEFGERLVKYFPYSLQSLNFYIGLAIIIHTCFHIVSSKAKQTTSEVTYYDNK